MSHDWSKHRAIVQKALTIASKDYYADLLKPDTTQTIAS